MKRAFTLLEVTIAAALAAVLLAAAVTASTTIQRSLNSSQRAAQLAERRELLEEFFGPLLRQVGQNTIRPWEAVLTPCTAGDCRQQRVHLMSLSADPHIKMAAPWNGVTATVDIDQSAGACPLSATTGWTGPRTVIIAPETTSTPTTFTPGWVSLRCAPDLTNCRCALSPVPGVNDNAETGAAITSAMWGRARIAIGETITLARDPAKDELIMRRDVADDGTREAVRVIDGVIGVDVAYGLALADGTIAFAPALSPTTFSDLRVLRLELALGLKDGNLASPASVQLANGAPLTRPGLRLTKSTTNAVLVTASSL